jgi:hypothetical protein
MTVLEMGGRRDEALGQLEDSAAALARVRRGSNTHAQSVERLGLAYLRVGRFERAIPLLEESRALWAQRARPSCGLCRRSGSARHGLRSGRAPPPVGCSTRPCPSSEEPAHRSGPRGDVHLVRASSPSIAARPPSPHRAGPGAHPLRVETRADLTRRVLADAGRARLALATGQLDGAGASGRLLELVRTPRWRSCPGFAPWRWRPGCEPVPGEPRRRASRCSRRRWPSSGG